MLRKRPLILLLLVIPLFGFRSTLHSDFMNHFVNDIRETQKEQTFESAVASLTYDDNAKRLIVGRESGDLEIWDMTKNLKQTIPKAHSVRADRVWLTADGKAFFSSSSILMELKLWDAQTYELLYALPNFLGPVVRTQVDHLYLVVGTSNIQFFDIQQKKLYRRRFGTSGSVVSMAVDGRTGFVATGTSSGTIDLFEIVFVETTPTLVKINEIEPYTEDGDWVIAVHFSPDAKHLYSVSRYGAVDEWSVPEFEKKRSLRTHKSHVYEAKFLPKKELVALVSETTTTTLTGGDDFFELLPLSSGKSVVRPLPVNFGVIVFIPPLGKAVAVSGRSVRTIDLP